MKSIVTIGLLAALISSAHAATIVNVDFNGVQGSESVGGTASISGAGGGGTVFNGVLVDSRGGNYALNVTSGPLVDSNGSATGVGFTINNVGGDNNPGADSPQNLYGDYIYNNDGPFGGHNVAGSGGSAFTISGLGNATTADLYFYDPSFQNNPYTTLTTTAGASSGAYGNYNGLNATLYQNVIVTDGKISGAFGATTSTFNILSGLTVVYTSTVVPEPSTYALVASGLVGLFAIRRFRVLNKN